MISACPWNLRQRHWGEGFIYTSPLTSLINDLLLAQRPLLVTLLRRIVLRARP